MKRQPYSCCVSKDCVSAFFSKDGHPSSIAEGISVSFGICVFVDRTPASACKATFMYFVIKTGYLCAVEKQLNKKARECVHSADSLVCQRSPCALLHDLVVSRRASAICAAVERARLQGATRHCGPADCRCAASYCSDARLTKWLAVYGMRARRERLVKGKLENGRLQTKARQSKMCVNRNYILDLLGEEPGLSRSGVASHRCSRPRFASHRGKDVFASAICLTPMTLPTAASGNTGFSSGPHLHFDVVRISSCTVPPNWRDLSRVLALPSCRCFSTMT
eukprot:6192648-Pleurochrysis_carterae.AAC.1